MPYAIHQDYGEFRRRKDGSLKMKYSYTVHTVLYLLHTPGDTKKLTSKIAQSFLKATTKEHKESISTRGHSRLRMITL